MAPVCDASHIVHELAVKACEANGWTIEGDRLRLELDDGRHQMIYVESYEREGRSFLRLYSPFGRAEGLEERRLRAALRFNWTLREVAVAIACLSDDGEHVVLRSELPLEGADAQVLEQAIWGLAKTADDYEKFVFGTDEY